MILIFQQVSFPLGRTRAVSLPSCLYRTFSLERYTILFSMAHDKTRNSRSSGSLSPPSSSCFSPYSLPPPFHRWLYLFFPRLGKNGRRPSSFSFSDLPGEFLFFWSCPRFARASCFSDSIFLVQHYVAYASPPSHLSISNFRLFPSPGSGPCGIAAPSSARPFFIPMLTVIPSRFSFRRRYPLLSSAR